MWVRMRAALARAVAVVAAAGAVRAIAVVRAFARVDADPLFTGAASVAIAVAAAFGADIGRLPEATEQPVAAVVLLRAIAPAGHRHFTAGLTLVLATIGHRHANTGVADLAFAAIAVATALGAIAGIT